MKKCYTCTVLYCSIAFFGKGCDCCKKLCGDKVLNNKSNYSGCDSEKSCSKKNEDTLIPQKHIVWCYKNNKNIQSRKRLSNEQYQNNNVVIILEPHSFKGEKIKYNLWFSSMDETLAQCWKDIYEKYCSESPNCTLYLYLRGDMKYTYNGGTDSTVNGNMTMRNIYLEFADLQDGLLYISYYFK